MWAGSRWIRAAIAILVHGVRDQWRLRSMSVDQLAGFAPDGMSMQEQRFGIEEVCCFARQEGIQLDGDPVRANPGPMVNDNP